MRKLSLAELSEIVEKAPAERSPPRSPAIAPARQAYREAAAVLAWFDPKELRPVGAAQPATATLHLAQDVMPAPAARNRSSWMLRGEVRTEALRRLAERGGFNEALAANPARADPTTLQGTLSAYLSGERPSLDDLDPGALTNVLQVVLWLAPVLDGLPDPDAVRARLREARLLAPYYALAGTHFHGRESELEDLRAYVGVIATGGIARTVKRGVRRIRSSATTPLVVEGAGGIGKSTLISRFILDHADVAGEEPLAFVYLDFDDPYLHADDWRSWLRLGVRQLQTQVEVGRRKGRPVGAIRQFESLAEAIGRRVAPEAKAPRLPDQRVVADFARLAELAAPASGKRTPRLLLVLDTFEEFQYRGEAELLGVAELLGGLAREHPALRTVIAGRLPVKLPGLSVQTMQLPPLDDGAAAAFLADNDVPAELTADVVHTIGGNPLTLSLAARVLVEQPDQTAELLKLNAREGWWRRRINDAVVQGWLYDRILLRIEDVEVRALVRAGLVVRTIDTGVVADVLQPALRGESTSPPGALMSDLRRVLQPTEEGALRHRTDVRRAALPLLERADPNLVARVDARAVQHYRKLEGSAARAEEIYHMLRLRTPAAELDKRWDPEAGESLWAVLDEFGPSERVWLAGQLGSSVDEDARRQADLDEWERQAAAAARDLLKVNRPREAYERLTERDERTAASPLYLLSAWALIDMGDLSRAQKEVDKGLAMARPRDDTSALIGLSVLAATIADRRGDVDSAAKWIDEAGELAKGGEPLRALRVHLQGIELAHRMGNRTRATSHTAELATAFAEAPDAALREHPELVRGCATELGDNPRAVKRALALVGFGDMAAGQRMGLAGGLSHSSPAGLTPSLVRTFNVDPASSPDRAWQAIVDNADSLGRLDEIVARVLDETGDREDLSSSVADALAPPEPPAPDLSAPADLDFF
jgi:tetratricopeptide (TPR) repeat protein